jgi:Ser-tRNA(Ala) deacylase AlaX
MKEKLHTCDHILFTILNEKYNAETTSMQFEEDSCRVEYKCETDLIPLKTEIENFVNEIINKNL